MRYNCAYAAKTTTASGDIFRTCCCLIGHWYLFSPQPFFLFHFRSSRSFALSRRVSRPVEGGRTQRWTPFDSRLLLTGSDAFRPSPIISLVTLMTIGTEENVLPFFYHPGQEIYTSGGRRLRRWGRWSHVWNKATIKTIGEEICVRGGKTLTERVDAAGRQSPEDEKNHVTHESVVYEYVRTVRYGCTRIACSRACFWERG